MLSTMSINLKSAGIAGGESEKLRNYRQLRQKEALRAFCEIEGCTKPPLYGRIFCFVHSRPGKKAAKSEAKETIGKRVYIYAIRCGEFVKIGQTVDPEGRLAAMQTGNPHELEHVGHVLMHQHIERALHNKLMDFRHRLEWFRLEGPVKDVVDLIAKRDHDGIEDFLFGDYRRQIESLRERLEQPSKV